MSTSAGWYQPGITSYLVGDHRDEIGGVPSGRKSASKDVSDRPKVLVVDDEDLIADSVAEILNRNGYDATARYSGRAAIQYVEVQCPDIVVADVIMPDYNGIQLAKTIRLQCPEARILLFSGNAATSDLVRRASTEGQSFEVLAKPVHPLQLLKALKS